jgi:biotin-(acetyl-CoA carboxylase) ligase
MVSGKSVILIGVGVNIFESPGEVPEATDLASVCQQESRELPDYLNLVTGLIIGIVSKWSQFEKSGFGNQQIAEWTERACGIGKPIEIDSGERVISGVMQGISRCGALLVKTVHGVQEVHAGHVLSPQVHSLSQEE